MDAMEAIMTRRSVREFADKPVEESAVETLLRAAMAAPSAGNEQPWHFVTVRDRGRLNAIAEAHPHAGMMREAGLCIAVVGEKSLEKHEGMMVQDLSAATQNLLLAAHALGLGAVWCGVHPRPERERGVAKVLGLPDSATCLCVIAIGYPKNRQAKVDRYLPARVHRERW